MNNANYIMLSKGVLLQKQLGIVSNNIANVNTDSFKSREMIFEDILVREGNSRKQNNFVEDIHTHLNLEQGPIKFTERKFDVAIQAKEGFFAINTPLGIRYTRLGNFFTNEEGVLQDINGNSVMSLDKEEIVLEPGSNDIKIDDSGMIRVNNEEVQRIGVFTFDNYKGLEHFGENMFKSEFPDQALELNSYKIIQGALEGSNVNSVNELSNLINLERSFEGIARINSSLDDMERNAIRIIAKPN